MVQGSPWDVVPGFVGRVLSSSWVPKSISETKGITQTVVWVSNTISDKKGITQCHLGAKQHYWHERNSPHSHLGAHQHFVHEENIQVELLTRREQSRQAPGTWVLSSFSDMKGTTQRQSNQKHNWSILLYMFLVLVNITVFLLLWSCSMYIISPVY